MLKKLLKSYFESFGNRNATTLKKIFIAVDFYF
nr:MAG TPA: protein of unknown function (DUF4440) [Caudoviricetes sp.]